MAAATGLEGKLKSSPWFADVDDSQLSWLIKVGQLVTLARQDFLFRRGELCAHIFILLSGHIKLSIPDERGQEKVIEFLSPGKALGESALLPGHRFIADAQALDACELLSFSSVAVRAAIKRVPSFAEQLLMSLSLRFESLLRDIESVSLRTAAQRVVEYLLIQPRTGDLANLPFHKRVIASKLGLQPETFSRSLQKLATDGLITVRGARVVIHDVAKMQALLA